MPLYIFGRFVFALMLIFGLALPVMAQDDDEEALITDDVIMPGQTVTDSISDRGLFDFWRFYLESGDSVRVTMEGFDGLAPLVGIADDDGSVIARSDISPDGEQLEQAGPNETVTLEFTAPFSGQYTIVPTRAGNVDGTTTGSYNLTLELTGLGTGSLRDRDTREVTFRCGADMVTTAAMVEFSVQPGAGAYTISVYGLNGFRPMIRTVIGDQREITDCGRDPRGMEGDQLILLDGTTHALPDDLSEDDTTARFIISEPPDPRLVEATIASVDGSPGAFVIVVEGFHLRRPGDIKDFDVYLGPRARDTELLVYMARVGRTRLDPFLTYLIPTETGWEYVECDDAGRRGCEDVPSLDGAGLIFGDGRQLIGDRFDAGLRLAPDNTDRMVLEFSSRTQVMGEYAVLIFGELPPSGAPVLVPRDDE